MRLYKRFTAVVLCIVIAALCFASASAAEALSQTGSEALTADEYELPAITEGQSNTEISYIAPTEAAVPSTILGDIDSDLAVTIDDAYYLRLHYAGFITLPDDAVKRSDADLDNSFSLIDASFIQGYLAGIETECYLGMDINKAKNAKAAAEQKEREQKILDEINNFERSKGVDISEFNGNVDMNKLKAQGFTFVMIRLGYGDDEKDQDDNMFETNVKKAEAAGLDWGAYIYSYALSAKEAKSEVSHTLRLLKGKKPTMPIAFDWEDDNYKQRMGMPSNSVLRDICSTYLSGIKAAGYYPILYTGYSWLKGAFNHPSIIDTYDIWYAQWNTTCDYTDRPVGMWQYGGEVNYIDTPYISGLKGPFDKDYSYKNYPMIIKAYGYNNHTALLSGGLASTAAAPDMSVYEACENLPEGLNGVMGDSLRNR